MNVDRASFYFHVQKVFAEAEEMAKKYRKKISAISTTRKLEPPPTEGLPFEDEEKFYANWKWFKFERGDKLNPWNQKSG